jgi:hypothetical protein
MGLDRIDVVDAVGVDVETGDVVLTILDSWDWTDDKFHLLQLQAKLNAYFGFIEEGGLVASYPTALGRRIVIDLVTRYPLAKAGCALVKMAQEAAGDLQVSIRTRCIPEAS